MEERVKEHGSFCKNRRIWQCEASLSHQIKNQLRRFFHPRDILLQICMLNVYVRTSGPAKVYVFPEVPLSFRTCIMASATSRT